MPESNVSVGEQYLVLDVDPDLLSVYTAGQFERMREYLQQRVFHVSADDLRFRVAAMPSRRWKLWIDDRETPTEARGPLLVTLEFDEPEMLRHFQSLLPNLQGKGLQGVPDMRFSPADHWCPGTATDPIFGTRADARRLIGADQLAAAGVDGARVNVVVIDDGLDRNVIRNFRGGWSPVGGRLPGATLRSHGTMVARNIQDLAPAANIFDCVLLPERIGEPTAFLGEAHAVYLTMLDDIKWLQDNLAWPGPWIFVNAWAIFDRSREYPPGGYSQNPNHPFNLIVADAARRQIDVVFAAGNCGAFCPSSRCGATDRGPGSSIFGANSHPDVLTVGAVRCDGMWLGFSSQGPGQPQLQAEKPDLCAPSQFSEVADRFVTHTGSSAACGLAAGAMAALRSQWDWAALPGDRLRELLRQTARPRGAGWNGRLGYGILDAAEAYRQVLARPAGPA